MDSAIVWRGIQYQGQPGNGNPNNPLGNPVGMKIAISNKIREIIYPQQNCLPKHTRLPRCVFQIE